MTTVPWGSTTLPTTREIQSHLNVHADSTLRDAVVMSARAAVGSQ